MKSLSMNFSEVIISASKKARKETGISGVITTSNRVRMISRRAGLFKMSKGQNMQHARNQKVTSAVGHFPWFGYTQKN
jgi:anti-anti-sigma regulatory factor